MSKAINKRITLVEAPHKRAICETKMRYEVHFDGKYFGELWFNTRGYVGYLPSPNGARVEALYPGELSISAYKKEIAELNREWKALSNKTE